MISIFEKVIDPRYLVQDPKRLLTFAYDAKNSKSMKQLDVLNKIKMVQKLRRSK